MPLDDGVDLWEIAESSPDFSGADLKALLYNAQLEVAHEALRRTQELKTFEAKAQEEEREEEEAVDTRGLEDSAATLMELPRSFVRRSFRARGKKRVMVFRWSPSGVQRHSDPQLEKVKWK